MRKTFRFWAKGRNEQLSCLRQGTALFLVLLLALPISAQSQTPEVPFDELPGVELQRKIDKNIQAKINRVNALPGASEFLDEIEAAIDEVLERIAPIVGTYDTAFEAGIDPDFADALHGYQVGGEAATRILGATAVGVYTGRKTFRLLPHKDVWEHILPLEIVQEEAWQLRRQIDDPSLISARPVEHARTILRQGQELSNSDIRKLLDSNEQLRAEVGEKIRRHRKVKVAANLSRLEELKPLVSEVGQRSVAREFVHNVIGDGNVFRQAGIPEFDISEWVRLSSTEVRDLANHKTLNQLKGYRRLLVAFAQHPWHPTVPGTWYDRWLMGLDQRYTTHAKTDFFIEIRNASTGRWERGATLDQFLRDPLRHVPEIVQSKYRRATRTYIDFLLHDFGLRDERQTPRTIVDDPLLEKPPPDPDRERDPNVLDKPEVEGRKGTSKAGTQSPDTPNAQARPGVDGKVRPTTDRVLERMKRGKDLHPSQIRALNQRAVRVESVMAQEFLMGSASPAMSAAAAAKPRVPRFRNLRGLLRPDAAKQARAMVKQLLLEGHGFAGRTRLIPSRLRRSFRHARRRMTEARNRRFRSPKWRKRMNLSMGFGLAFGFTWATDRWILGPIADWSTKAMINQWGYGKSCTEELVTPHYFPVTENWEIDEIFFMESIVGRLDETLDGTLYTNYHPCVVEGMLEKWMELSPRPEIHAPHTLIGRVEEFITSRSVQGQLRSDDDQDLGFNLPKSGEQFSTGDEDVR